MANSYTQIHIHTIFAVRTRAGLIQQQWRDDLYKYIVGIIQRNQHKVLSINGMPDHIHILFGMRPVQSLSDLMQDVKGSSSKWINDQRFVIGHFEWQSGYGAFSYSKSADPSNNFVHKESGSSSSPKNIPGGVPRIPHSIWY